MIKKQLTADFLHPLLVLLRDPEIPPIGGGALLAVDTDLLQGRAAQRAVEAARGAHPVHVLDPASRVEALERALQDPPRVVEAGEDEAGVDVVELGVVAPLLLRVLPHERHIRGHGVGLDLA